MRELMDAVRAPRRFEAQQRAIIGRKRLERRGKEVELRLPTNVHIGLSGGGLRVSLTITFLLPLANAARL